MDKVSPSTRSKVMSSVKCAGTQLELRLAQAIRKAKLGSFDMNPRDIEGHPDFVFRKYRVAIFVDSCFWHGCRWHCRMPSSNVDYWKHKIAYNRERDRRITRSLRRHGWQVVRVWEHTIKTANGITRVMERIALAIKRVPNPKI